MLMMITIMPNDGAHYTVAPPGPHTPVGPQGRPRESNAGEAGGLRDGERSLRHILYYARVGDADAARAVGRPRRRAVSADAVTKSYYVGRQ
jgi:hypothetical protein